MIIDPFRLYRRHQRLLSEAREEAQYLRRRYGETAAAAAREKLTRHDLTSWGHRVVQRALREIERAKRRK